MFVKDGEDVTYSRELGVDQFGQFLETVEEIRYHRRPLKLWDVDVPPRTRFFGLWRKPRYEVFDRRDSYTAQDARDDLRLIQQTDWDLGDATVELDQDVTGTTFEATIPVRYDQTVGGTSQPLTANIEYSGIIDPDRDYQDPALEFFETGSTSTEA